MLPSNDIIFLSSQNHHRKLQKATNRKHVLGTNEAVDCVVKNNCSRVEEVHKTISQVGSHYPGRICHFYKCQIAFRSERGNERET